MTDKEFYLYVGIAIWCLINTIFWALTRHKYDFYDTSKPDDKPPRYREVLAILFWTIPTTIYCEYLNWKERRN